MLIDFCFIGKKTDFGRARRRKAAAFSFAKAGIDENIGLPGQQRATRCRSTVQLTEIRRQKVANGYTNAAGQRLDRNESFCTRGLQTLLTSSHGFATDPLAILVIQSLPLLSTRRRVVPAVGLLPMPCRTRLLTP